METIEQLKLAIKRVKKSLEKHKKQRDEASKEWELAEIKLDIIRDSWIAANKKWAESSVKLNYFNNKLKQAKKEIN